MTSPCTTTPSGELQPVVNPAGLQMWASSRVVGVLPVVPGTEATGMRGVTRRGPSPGAQAAAAPAPRGAPVPGGGGGGTGRGPVRHGIREASAVEEVAEHQADRGTQGLRAGPVTPHEGADHDIGLAGPPRAHAEPFGAHLGREGAG